MIIIYSIMMELLQSAYFLKLDRFKGSSESLTCDQGSGIRDYIPGHSSYRINTYYLDMQLMMFSTVRSISTVSTFSGA